MDPVFAALIVVVVGRLLRAGTMTLRLCITIGKPDAPTRTR